MRYTLRLKGGPGSGHHGHKGIPGHHGGSLPRGESNSSGDTGSLGEDIKYSVESSDNKPEFKFAKSYRTREEVAADFERHEISYAKKLTKEEKDALVQYTDSGSDTNSVLREGKLEDERDIQDVKLLDSALEKASFPRRAIATRYIVVPKDSDVNVLKDKIIKDAGYMSTSLEDRKYEDLITAYIEETLSQGSDVSDWKVVKMRITIPKGAKAACLQGTGDVWSTSEVLLQRNSRLSVTAVYDVLNEDYKVGGYPTTSMEMVLL